MGGLFLYLVIWVAAAIFLELVYSGTQIKKGEVWWPFIVSGALWPLFPLFFLIYWFTRK